MTSTILALVIIITFIQIWSVFVFAILCATTMDVLVIMGICIFFLMNIVIRT